MFNNRFKYFFVDIKEINLIDPIYNEDIDINNYTIQFNLPDKYKKFILGCNLGFNCNQIYNVSFNEGNTNIFFEVLSNHPLNIKSASNKTIYFNSSTFGKYLSFVLTSNHKKNLTELEAINFYKELIENGYFNEYARMVYGIFTNAYNKDIPKLPSEINDYRKIKIFK